MARTKVALDAVWWTAACSLLFLFGAQPRPGAFADAERLRERALVLEDRGEVGEAIAVATEATELAPNDARSWAVLGCLHAAAGHSGEARASFEHGAGLGPSPGCPAP